MYDLMYDFIEGCSLAAGSAGIYAPFSTYTSPVAVETSQVTCRCQGETTVPCEALLASHFSTTIDYKLRPGKQNHNPHITTCNVHQAGSLLVLTHFVMLFSHI